MIAHLYFAGRVDRLIMDLDRLGQRLVDLIAADGLLGADAERRPIAKRRDKAA
jgi:hypothetical protein